MCRVLPIDQSEITLFDPVADKARRDRLWKLSRASAERDAPVVKETVANFATDDRVGGKVIQAPSEWKNKRMPKIAYVKKTAAHNPPPIESKKIVTPLDLTKELLRGISEKYDVHIDNMLGQCRKKEFVTARMHAYLTAHYTRELRKAERIRDKRTGAMSKSSAPLPCGRNSPWKKTFSGQIVRRHP